MDPQAGITARERLVVLFAAMSDLTEPQLEVIWWHYFRGLTAQEIAEMGGTSETAVFRLQARAVAALHVALERRGIRGFRDL